MTESEAFVCPHCGKSHAGLPADWGFRLPDVVHSLSYLEEYQRSRSNVDLCTLDEARYFIRGVLSLPFKDSNDYFGWGIWAEVSPEAHDICVRYFHADGTAVPRFTARIANSLPGYESTLGVEVEIQLSESGRRPMFWMPRNASHPLAAEQSQGISEQRRHELLEAAGYFDKEA